MSMCTQQNWKRFITYLVVFNYSLTSCVWAMLTPLQTLPEFYVGPSIRALTPSMSYVIPGVLDDAGAHAFFEQLDIKSRTSLIFDTPEIDVPTFVRIMGSDPSEISSATIATSQYERLFFSNPHGFRLYNPVFKNIRALNLVAGELYQTPRGMVTAVDRGHIYIQHTTLAPDDAVKSICLAGRSIDIRQSQIDTMDEIYLKVGSYLSALNSGETEELDYSPPMDEGIFTSSDTMLRSKSIVIESLNDEGNVVIEGMLYSTYGDITIRAKGDVILHKFLSTANLNIQTTGQVIFEDEGLIVGNLQIQASSILLKKNISVNGKTKLQAANALRILNALTSEGEMILFGNEFRNYGGVFGGKNIFIKTLETNNLGCVAARGQIGLETDMFTNSGDVESFGGIAGNVQNATYNNGSIRTRHNFIFRSGQFTNTAKAKIFTLGIHQLDVAHHYEDAGHIYAPLLFLMRAGSIDYKGSHRFFGNEGLIQASRRIKASAGSDFLTQIYLKFKSDGDIDHAGNVSCNLGASYPYASYFPASTTLSSLPSGILTDFAEQVAAIPLGQYKKIKDVRKKLHAKRDPRTVAFDAKGKLTRSGVTLLNNGSVSYKADGSFISTQHTSHAGIFDGNDTLIQAATVLMNETNFSSPAGAFSLEAELGNLKDSLIHAVAQGHAFVGSLSLDRSRIWSAASTIESQDLRMVRSALESTEGMSVVKVVRGYLEDAKTAGVAGVSITATEKMVVDGLNSKGPSTVVTAPELRMANIEVDGALAASGSHLKLAGSISGLSVQIQGEDKLENDAHIKVKNTAIVEAKKAYTATERATIEAGQRAELIAPQISSFNGVLKAHTVSVYVKDMDLLDLLGHVEASAAEVRLDSDVILGEDHVFQHALSLWAQSLEMKAHITANSDFMVETQKDILNTGVLLGAGEGYFIAGGSFINRGELSLEDSLAIRAKSISNEGKHGDVARMRTSESITLQSTEGSIRSIYGQLNAKRDITAISVEDVVLKATEASATRNMTVAANRNVELKSVSRGVGAKDEKDTTSLTAGEALKVLAGQDLLLVGVKTRSGEGGTLLKAGRQIIDMPLALKSETSILVGGESRHDEWVTQSVSEHISTGDVVAEAGERAHFYATKFHGRNIRIFGKEGVSFEEVHNQHAYKKDSQKEGGGQSTKTHGEGVSLKSQGANFTAKGIISIKSDGKIDLTGATFHASDTILEAPEIRILLGKNYSQSGFTKESSNIAWQSAEQRVEKHESRRACEFDGTLTIASKETVLESVYGKTLDYMSRIKGNPGTISRLFVDELHHVDEHKSEGPTKALAAVIVLAVSIATSGAGVGIAGALYGTSTAFTTVALSSMTAVAFSSICSQAALALVSNQGDIVKAAESLVSTDSLNSIGLSMLTAGLTAGAGNILGVPVTNAHSFGEHLTSNTLKQGVRTATSVVLGQPIEHTLVTGARGVVAGVIGGTLSNTLGSAYDNNDINGIEHKVFHTMLGATTGAIVSDDLGSGAFSGGIGALAAETFADIFSPKKPTSQSLYKEVQALEYEKGRHLSQEELQALVVDTDNAYKDRVSTTSDWAKVISGMAAFSSGADIATSTFTAANAIENNFLYTAFTVPYESPGIPSDRNEQIIFEEPDDFLSLASSDTERFQSLQASTLYKRDHLACSQQNYLIDEYESLLGYTPETYTGNIYPKVLQPSATLSNYSAAAECTAHDPINNRTRWALQTQLLQYGIKYGYEKLNLRAASSAEFSYQMHESAFQFSNNVSTIGRFPWMILTKYDVPHWGRRVGDWFYQPSAFISGIGAGFTDLAYTHNPESAERAFVSIYNLQMSQKFSLGCQWINSAIEITNSPHGVGTLPWYGRYLLRPVLDDISVLTRPLYK